MTSSTLDDETASAIRRGIGAASAGRLAEACRIGEEALSAGAAPGPLHAMLGSFYCRAGDIENGVRHLQLARSAQPHDLIVAFNLASALTQRGDYAGALAAIPQELADRDNTLRLQRLRAFAAQSLGRFPEAIMAYERVVAAAPDDWESWNNLGNSHLGAGNIGRALHALRRAVAINPQGAPQRYNLAAALASAGNFADAEVEFKASSDLLREDPRALKDLHALLRLQGREQEALKAIEAAVVRSPTDSELLLGLASQRLLLLDNDGAEAAYRQVISQDPSNALANLGLAVVFELANRVSDLEALVAEAAARKAGSEVVEFIRAFALRRSKRFEEGLAALANVPLELEPARRAQLLGQLSDGAGKYDDAWRAFERMNELQRADSSEPERRADPVRALLRYRIESLTPEWAATWKEFRSQDGRPSPAFLVGFPRSGTTLLDTMLMGHPEVEVLEEEPTIAAANAIFPDFQELAEASGEKIQAARDSYFEAVAARTATAPGKLIVDKNPLLMNALPLIRRMFPDARIILAVRHPCDVVLSCFATNFKLNDGTANFLRLESTAEMYDLSFRFLEQSLKLLPLAVHRLRYEDLVADREEELRSLFEFLELSWAEEALDHQATASRRGRIKTASYAQVSEPIYSRSAGRWQHYRQHLQQVIPTLEPWALKLGYEI